MDAESIRQTIVDGESYTVEFKDGSINDAELVETVACLANGSGGQLLVGVGNDGELQGAMPRHGTTTEPNRVEALISNRTEPPVLTKVDLTQVDSVDLLVINVPASAQVVGTTDGRYVRRAIDVKGKPQCLPMRPHEVLSRAGTTGALDYSRVVLPNVSMDDLDTAELARFRDMTRSGGDQSLTDLSDLEVLRALNVVGVNDQLTTGALLLFGREEAIARVLPAYEIGFQELDDRLEVRASEIRRTPLLRAMLQLADRVKARNPEEEVEIGLFRLPLPRYAEVAVRELIANALVHRDYTLPGPTLVEIAGESLIVSNPGGFPEGVTVGNLLTTPPRPRNPALADAFKRAGLVDRTSRGINRVFASQLSLGRPPPDYTRSSQSSVVARVRSGPADAELAAFIAEARRGGQDFSLEDLLTLHEVRVERQITTARAAELFQVDQNEARLVLNRLADRGLIEARGTGTGRSYHLAAGLYRRLGEPDQYVRTRGFDDIQQEQMVLTYVRRHGSITRAQATELCQIGSGQASRLLRRIRDEGKLTMIGEKRTARYVAVREG